MIPIDTIRDPEIRPELRSPRRRSLVLLAPDGTFDLDAALRAASAVRARPPGSRVTLDLRRARVEDAALAAFVRHTASHPVGLLGVSRHHERLLRYLDGGLGADRDG